MKDISLYELVFEIAKYRDHKKRLRKITVSNTYNNNIIFDNIQIEFNVDIGFIQRDALYAVFSGEKMNVLTEEEIKFKELFKYGYDFRFKITCNDKYETLIQFDNIKRLISDMRYKFDLEYDTEYIIYGEDYNYGSIYKNKNEYEQHIINNSELNNIIKGLKNEIDDLKRQIIFENKFFKNEKKGYFSKYSFSEIMNKINLKIESHKNSYILSKITNGGLSKSDIENNPELIEVYDLLTLLNIMSKK